MAESFVWFSSHSAITLGMTEVAGLGITISGQTLDFLWSAALGFSLGALYDIFRITRVVFSPGKIFVFLQDVLYWLLCAVASFLFILTINQGEIRAFILIGELIGGIVYYCTLGWVIIRCTQMIANAVKRFFRFVYRFTLAPIRRLFHKLGRKTRKGAGGVGRKVKKFQSILHLRLKRDSTLLYNFFIARNKRKDIPKDQ